MEPLESSLDEYRKGLKASPFGLIPIDWEIVELDDVVEFLDGRRTPIKDSDRALMQGKYPYYGASGIIDYVNDFIFDDELILLGEDGANIINRSSPLAFRVTGKIWVNNHAHVLKPKPGTNVGYLTEFLESIKYDKYNTGTAQPKLNKEVCSGIPILFPPEVEQTAIANLLSTWDRAIDLTARLIAQKELQKKWLMQQLLTGGTRLRGFKGEWKRVKLSDVFQRVNRKNSEGNTNVVTISAQKGFVRQEDFFTKVVASDITEGYFLVHKGEFCYNKSYSNGYPWGATKRLNDFEKAVVTTLYICFSIKSEAENSGDFFEQYLGSGILDKGLMRIAHEGGRAHGLLNVTPDDFFGLQLSLPDYSEQAAIAQVFNLVDKNLKLLKRKLDKLKEQKKGLMQILLTGRKRLNSITCG